MCDIASLLTRFHKQVIFVLQLEEKYSSIRIIQGIKSNDNGIMKYIYRTYYRKVVGYVRRKIGNEEDAKDIFQETLIIIETQVKECSFSLRSTFRAYIFSISRVLCLRYLEKKGIRKRAFAETGNADYIADNAVDINQNINDKIEESERYQLYLHHFSKLCENYQKIIRLKLDKVPLKEIAMRLGYENEKQVRNIIYYCKNKLISDIKNDPVYDELCLKTTKELTY